VAKGKTKSKLTLRQRREQAYRLFAQGVHDIDVARELKVSRKTVASYRQRYEGVIEEEAGNSPTLLQDVLKSTVRALRELDLIRADAWKRLTEKPTKHKFDCESCGDEVVIELPLPPTDQARVQYQNVLLKAQEQRAKLLGVLGVKQEVFIQFNNIKIVQDKVLEWMGRNLCATDRERLAVFMETELQQYLGPTTEPIEVQAIEAFSVES
jgi:hypothetical protein